MSYSFVTIVSGLPRSGTSMMMRMLNRGGMELLADCRREPDCDNPQGYYEYEPVKRTAACQAWVASAQGRAVKVIYRFVQVLPSTFEYKIILMHRGMDEVLASQKKMLERRGEIGAGIDDESLKQAFIKIIEELGNWIDRQPNMTRLDASYNNILADPTPFCHRLNMFLDNRLDVGSMLDAIDPRLYRNRF